MVKDLDANIITEKDAQSKRPRVLAELRDVYGRITLRFAASETNITFPNGGTTWTAKAFRYSGNRSGIETQISRITVEFDNVARDMAAYLSAYQFLGGTLHLKRVYLDSSGNAPSDEDEYDEIFYGTMESPKDVTMMVMPITATVGKPLVNKTLKLKYTKLCDHVFGNSKCNRDGYANMERVRGQADSGSTTTLVDSDLIQKDDYWNSGQILIIKGTNAYVATVTDFADGTVTFASIGTSVDSTCFYVLTVQSTDGLMTMGTADSGSTTTLVDNALTEADDYWNFGIIEVIKDGSIYRRNVLDFDASSDTITLDSALPVSIDSTCKYFLIKGCDKNWETCQSNNVYGPETDNSANFLGFIHIGIGTKTGFTKPWQDRIDIPTPGEGVIP